MLIMHFYFTNNKQINVQLINYKRFEFLMKNSQIVTKMDYLYV